MPGAADGADRSRPEGARAAPGHQTHARLDGAAAVDQGSRRPAPSNFAAGCVATTDFDLVVVGGGINGAGIAREAAGRDLRVCLVEQHDLAAHTSSASTKLIHGGLRYLEHGELRLVREALAERERLLAIAPAHHPAHALRAALCGWPPATLAAAARAVRVRPRGRAREARRIRIGEPRRQCRWERRCRPRCAMASNIRTAGWMTAAWWC